MLFRVAQGQGPAGKRGKAVRLEVVWLHSRNPCVQAGFDTAGHTPELCGERRIETFWKPSAPRPPIVLLRTPCVSPAGSSGFARQWQWWWCRWFDLSPNAEAAARHKPKPYVSLPPKSIPSRMTSPSYPPRRVTQGPSTRPRASKPKRASSVRRRVSALLDFDPSVSPQGEAGEGEAAAKTPRWIKHDRGQSEPPQRQTRTAPVQTAAAPGDRAPAQGPVCSPHPHRAIRQQRRAADGPGCAQRRRWLLACGGRRCWQPGHAIVLVCSRLRPPARSTSSARTAPPAAPIGSRSLASSRQ
jgi:hypothetical protein